MRTKFWDSIEMNKLMKQYLDLFHIDREQKEIKLKNKNNERLKNQLYTQIHIKHRQMAEVVAPHKRTVDFDKRCDACVGKMYEVMIFNWNPAKNPNSYGYFYRTAYTFTVDWLKGRHHCSTELYSKVQIQTGNITLTKQDLPENETIETYADWLSSQSNWTSHDVKKKGDKYTVTYTISYRPFTSIDEYEYLDLLDVPDSHFDRLEELIDWQILSEYIPDVDANETNKDIAYVLIECLEEVLDNDDLCLPYRALNVLLYEMVQSRMPIVISKTRLAHVRTILRQAFKYYAEEYIDYDNLYRGI